MLTDAIVEECRGQFPALVRAQDGRPVVYLDGPSGSQVPQRVIDAIAAYLSNTNANRHGRFATSRESDAILDAAHGAVADLLGADDPQCVWFGPNMTSLAFALSRALGRTWRAGDRILVTRLDHDANVTPWVRAARDVGVEVDHVAIRPDDCTLDLDDLASKLTDRTRLTAVGCASNLAGTVNPVGEICRLARQAGSLSFLDAVHYAPHAPMDVAAWGCDFLGCSSYKFFGPHVGVMWGRRDLLEELDAYKVRPAPDSVPERWMTGTQNHEGIAGTHAAVGYLEDLGRRVAPESADRRAALRGAMDAITAYEADLVRLLIEGLLEMPAIRVHGITEPNRAAERVPTVSITHRDLSPQEMAERLGRAGIFVCDGNFYALPLTEALGLEPDGLIRLGLLHYNTRAEVERVLDEIRRL
ncbi:MAG: cysteine desulfurase-like protein [Phycisphaeraceae bacterium]|nr:cysteine desulfurase-like protein [Phycisphaeraceae bacterium]